MAIPKVIIATLFLVMFVLHEVQAIQTDQLAKNDAVSGTTYNSKIECGGACAERCKLSSRPNLCKRACGTCCARCNCVPSGTYGNYQECECYAKMTTRGNKRKCP